MSINNTLARGLNPVLLARACGIDPDPWQAEFLRSDSRQMILLCCRQSGKSTISSILALYKAFYHPNSNILLLSKTQRQSQDLFKKVIHHLKVLPTDERPAIIKETGMQLELANGSKIVALPGSEDTIRGKSAIDLMIIDEAAFVYDSFYFTVRPMLAVSQGRMVAISTPHSKRGWFYDTWTQEDNGWHKIKITARECPRITPEILEQERTVMPSYMFKTEYECEFMENEGQLIPTEYIMRAIKDVDWTPL